jgi:serine/threonine protein kinase
LIADTLIRFKLEKDFFVLHDLTGQMIGHYQIIRPIEQGGMATVYLARDIHLQRQVAIKVFQFVKNEGRADEYFYRFTREAQVVARLDHPNIVLVHDYGEQDNLAYLVMPYFAQGSLKQLLSQRARLPIPEALHFIFQLLDALQYAHERGLIHRDIKPGNILFKNDQTAVLADFGLVKEMVTGSTGEVTAIGLSGKQQHPLTDGAIMGTPYYMATEQMQGQVQPQSDIYSIGLVLYEMLTGRLPFAANSQDGALSILLKPFNDAPLPVTDLNPRISTQLGTVIMCALEKDVAQRYQRPGDFSEALSAAVQQSMGSFVEGTVPESVGYAQFDRLEYTKNDQDANATTPLHPLESGQTASSIKNASTHPAHIGAIGTSLISRNAQRTAPKRGLSYLLYSLLATILLVTLGITSPLLLPLIHFNFTSTVTSIFHPNSGHVSVVKSPVATQPPTQSAATVAMPATQTSCPPTGQVRAAVLEPYASQGDNLVVYSSSFYDATDKGHGALMGYDVATGKSRSIITVPHMLANVQVAADGQWVIFSTYDSAPGAVSLIQMVRIDGQGLQTLYCTSSAVNYLLASPGLDPENPAQGWSLFLSETTTGNSFTLVFLNIGAGKILQSISTTHSYRPITWFGDQLLYLLDGSTYIPYDAATQSSIVRFSLGDPQASSDGHFTVEVEIPAFCSDADFSTDFTTLFTSHCTGQGSSNGGNMIAPSTGPSQIAKLIDNQGTWSPPKTIFTSQTQAVIAVRAITATSLLVLVGNGDQYNNQNGLWKMNTDGSDPQRLTTEKSDATLLNSASQYPWSNVSIDGKSYAFKTGSLQAQGYDNLFVGSLSGGQPKVIAAAGVGGINRSSVLSIAGWTTI